MSEKKSAPVKLKISPSIFRANILRLFGTVSGAADKLGVKRQHLYFLISAGKISNSLIGRLHGVGVDPAELTKKSAKNGEAK